jgi:hypothetical protein
VLKKVINHFEKYPLQTQKRADFELFKAIVMIVESKKHLIPEGFQEILNHKAYLNNGLPAAIIEAFDANNPNQPFPLLRANLKPVLRLPSIINPQIPDPQWLAGFTDGEGCFSISVAKNSATETGYLVSLRFQISQHLRDENLLRSFINYFGCGRFYPLNGTKKRGDFAVTKLTDNLNIIIPFFLKNPLLGIKAYDFKLWCEAADIMTKKEHLASEGLNKILNLKALINKKSTNGVNNNNKVFLHSSNKNTNSPNNICSVSCKNLIDILSASTTQKQPAIYHEVFKIIQTNLHLLKNMSADDKQALNNKSNRKVLEIIKNIQK